MLWGLAVTWGTEVIRSPVENKDSSLDCSSGGRKEAAENLQEEDHWGLTHAAGSQYHLLVRTQAASTLSSPPCSAGWALGQSGMSGIFHSGAAETEMHFPWNVSMQQREVLTVTLGNHTKCSLLAKSHPVGANRNLRSFRKIPVVFFFHLVWKYCDQKTHKVSRMP